ncbi:hypothetical protein AMK11_33585 [Streptomyces sp. CB02414]|nr:hypothetical protein AMK11_33585 [Streptomyces sp. CB02414]
MAARMAGRTSSAGSPAPGPAEVAALLQDTDPSDAPPAQRRARQDAAEPAADDRDVHPVPQGLALHRLRLRRVRIVGVVAEPGVGGAVLPGAVGAHAPLPLQAEAAPELGQGVRGRSLRVRHVGGPAEDALPHSGSTRDRGQRCAEAVRRVDLPGGDDESGPVAAGHPAPVVGGRRSSGTGC